MRILFSRMAVYLPSVFLGVGLALGLAACGSSESSPEATPGAESDSGDVQRYALRGKVVQLETENQAAVIEHEEITGWMDAMTMRFPVKEAADWEKLSVGAQIEATVFVSDDGFHIGEVKVLEGEEPAEAEQP